MIISHIFSKEFGMVSALYEIGIKTDGKIRIDKSKYHSTSTPKIKTTWWQIVSKG